MNNANNKKALVLIVPFFVLLCVFLLASIVTPDKTFSVEENRLLTMRPVYDLNNILAITDTFNTYVVDQFPERNQFLRIFSWMELIQGKKQARNTFIADREWLMTKTYLVGQETLHNFTQTIIQTAGQVRSAEVYYALLPVKNDVLEHLDSAYFDRTSSIKNKQNLRSAMDGQEDVGVIDISDYFMSKAPIEREKMYFKADFHWNATGAYEAFKYIQERFLNDGVVQSEERVGDENFAFSYLSNTRYQGDMNRRFSNLFSMQEAIPLIVPKEYDHIKYYLSVDNSQQVQREDLVGKGIGGDIVTYNDIFTGNLPFYRVINEEAPSKQKIVIFKDSFENPMTDYFSTLFYEVVVVDARYLSDISFEEIIETDPVDILLFIFHQNNCSPELVKYLAEFTARE